MESQNSALDQYNAYPSSPSYRLDTLLSVLRQIASDILAFNEVFTNLEESDLEHVKTPVTLVNAWMHLILSLATLKTDEKRSLQLAEKAWADMIQGMDEMIAARSEPLRLENLVVTPFDLVALIGHKLLKDVTPGLPDIMSTYRSYLSSIVREPAQMQLDVGSSSMFTVANVVQVSDIVTKPSRKIEHKLGLVTQELEIIDLVLRYQERLFEKMLGRWEGLAKRAESKFTEEDEDTWEQKSDADYRNDWRYGYRRAPRYNTMAAMAEGILEQGEPHSISFTLLYEGLKHLDQRASEIDDNIYSAKEQAAMVRPLFRSLHIVSPLGPFRIVHLTHHTST
jgi:hypothetical protein